MDPPTKKRQTKKHPWGQRCIFAAFKGAFDSTARFHLDFSLKFVCNSSGVVFADLCQKGTSSLRFLLSVCARSGTRSIIAVVLLYSYSAILSRGAGEISRENRHFFSFARFYFSMTPSDSWNCSPLRAARLTFSERLE
jgi:hypothetical protein